MTRKKITREKTLHKRLRIIMEHWEMLPVLDWILVEPSFLRHHWLKVDGKVPYKRADSRASALPVSICSGAVSANPCNKIGIFNLVFRPKQKWLGLGGAVFVTISTWCSWSCVPFIRNFIQKWEANCSSQVWKWGLMWLQVSISSFSFLKSHNTCFPKKHVSWTWIYQRF